jgi:hypothetical protein
MYNNILAENAVVDVIEADYIPPYKIHLWFSDGAEQIVNFERFLKNSNHPEIRKYLDVELFKSFSIAHGRLDWNDYDLCFPVKDLYEGTILKTPVNQSLHADRVGEAAF